MRQIKIGTLLPWIIITVMAYFLWQEFKKDPITEYIPVEVVVEVPVKEHVFDTVFMPKPIVEKVPVIDSLYYKEYLKLKDSVEKDSMFKEAIKIREYQVTFEDSVQAIDVYSKVRGTLLEQTAKYLTKPSTIVVKDSVPVPQRTKVFVGVEAGIPLAQNLNINGDPVAKVNLMLKPKRSEGFWTVGVDTESRVWVGKTWKISLRGKN